MGLTNSWANHSGSDPPLSPIVLAAERAGLNVMKVNRIYNGTQTYVSWADADALFCAIDEQDWGRDYSELVPYYWQGEVPPDMSKPFKCECEGCPDWFSVAPFHDGRIDPYRQRFCSNKCATRHRAAEKHRNENVGVKCSFPECGKIYTRTRRSQLYCKKQCKQNHYNRLKGVPRAHRRERNEEEGSTREAARGSAGATVAA